MNFTKIFGWGLIMMGVAIIGWALYSSYNIFTGKAQPPEIFKVEKKTNETSTLPKGKFPTGSTEIQQEMERMIEQQLKQILPAEIFSKLLNLLSWSILAGILILGGGQISSLGIKLIRKP